MLLAHTEDETHYRVGFIIFLSHPTDNRITVSLANVMWRNGTEPVPWAHKRHVYPNTWRFQHLAVPNPAQPQMRAEVIWRRRF